MRCQKGKDGKCDKLVKDLSRKAHFINLKTCGHCPKVKKIDLVEIVLEMDPIYLTERTRNKSGRKPILNADKQNDIKNKYRHGSTIGKLAKEYGVSRATIFNTVNK